MVDAYGYGFMPVRWGVPPARRRSLGRRASSYGVGSAVACSIEPGHARASRCGTSDGMSPALFLLP